METYHIDVDVQFNTKAQAVGALNYVETHKAKLSSASICKFHTCVDSIGKPCRGYAYIDFSTGTQVHVANEFLSVAPGETYRVQLTAIFDTKPNVVAILNQLESVKANTKRPLLSQVIPAKQYIRYYKKVDGVSGNVHEMVFGQENWVPEAPQTHVETEFDA
ncbi:MAG: hypothetical protein KAU50_11390 [Candidatus Marinimicrobia bacterium]|nr:hypothetical protein [Candidatus Neomarinimicrobiota bacterium]